MKVLCFDIGGTNIKYGVIEDYQILEKNMFPTNYKRGHTELTDRLIQTAKKVLEKYPDIEVDFHYGGQPLYYYLISLE